uniref:RNA-directed DNA polymerase n=1 Tax=Strongyloides papillosus TaxID=174720 RepID=A0A0N5BU44_STREA
MLKSINEKVADVDKLYEEITSVLRKTKMSSITMEELGGLLMILKFAAPEAMEPLLLKKAAEERLNNKSERRLAYAKEILDIIKELNTFSLALSSSKDSVHRVYTKSNDKFKKNTFKRKTFNKKIQCHRCNKYGHIARNCNEVIRKIEDNTSDIENESDDDEVVSVVGRIEGEKQLILPVKAYIGKKNCFVIKAEADSGSPRTFIARNQIPGKVELRKCSKRYVGVGGGEMATCGKIKMILEVNGRRVEIDASDTAMGAVLKAESGEIIEYYSKSFTATEYYSKSFTATECRYPIKHKEALSYVLAIEHFKYYLMLKEFQLHTNHEGLAICFNLEKGIKKSMSNRLQLKVYYVSNKRVLCADTLSRLTCGKRKNYLEEFLACKIHSKNELYLRESQILKEAELNENYLLIRDKLINNESTTHLGERFLDATVEDGLVKLGNQYLIPENLHQRCLEILHTSHQSSSTMKRLVRQFWYWSSMTKDIYEVYDKCEICNDNKIMPNKSLPFMENSLYSLERVHIGIEECFSIYFLVLHDSFSGYLDIFILKNMSTTECLSCLNRAFSYLGYPTSIFSNQGRQFISQDAKDLTLKHGITWYFSGAGHQSSNGAAERSIQTVKRQMKKHYKPGCDIDELFIKIKVNVNNVLSGKRQDSPNNLLFKYNCHSLVRTNEYLEGIPQFKIGNLIKFRLSKEKNWKVVEL